MSIGDLLDAARRGAHRACAGCPSSPRRLPNPAFGVSCLEHGIDWGTPASAISMVIPRDPANTTPARTGKLCFVCNSQNPSDRSALHQFELWRAAVALADEGEQSRRYLGRHYWTNAVLHGSDEEGLESARRCCREVLRDQIKLLSPKVIIAAGDAAAKSLHEIGLLKKSWPEFRARLASGVYREDVRLPAGAQAQVFCTYHTSARAVNCNVARLYSDATERELAKRIAVLEDPHAARAFLRRYDTSRTGSAEAKGMRVLLLHWLDIGAAIRLAHRQATVQDGQD